MADFVYAVDKRHFANGAPQVVAVKVKRETAKMYFVEHSSATDYKSSVSKDSDVLFKNSLEAAQAYLKRCRLHTDVARSTLEKYRQDERAAERLLAATENGESTPPYGNP